MFYIILFLACKQGYTGENCSDPCPYPSYGVECQNMCNCDKDLCNVSTGCQNDSTGIFFKKK